MFKVTTDNPERPEMAAFLNRLTERGIPYRLVPYSKPRESDFAPLPDDPADLPPLSQGRSV